jgi:predicted P-loop ATPase
MLIAALRRVRSPGCKFDEMVVIENEEQGTNKSSTLATLAVRNDWFSDDLPLYIRGKEIIESLRGRWIIEAAELSGMRRADIEHLKAFLSRQTDRARMVWDRIVTEVPRQCIIVGTTNALEYLKDTTGNRRFWPVHVGQFNIAKLRHNRDQLWAEAAAREAEGASIRLDPKLWPKAREEQEKRAIADPWFDTLQSVLGAFDQAKISTESIWIILNIRGGQLVQEHSRRVAAAMKRLGWKQNSACTIKLDGKDVVGFTRGDKPWVPIEVWRDRDGFLHVHREGDLPY